MADGNRLGQHFGGRAPLVSVVIPLYNKRDQIVSTLESVFAQQFTDYEVVVVNDGSTDGSAEMIQPFLDRVRYFEQPNSGASVARNRGIEMARGRFLAFLDADDLWEPDKLRAQMDFLDRRPDVSWCGSNLLMCEEGKETSNTVSPVPEGGSEWVVHPDWFTANLGKNITTTSSVVIRSNILREVGGFSRAIRAGQDMDLWIRIAMKHPMYGYCLRPLVRYGVLVNAITASGGRKFRSMFSYLRPYVELAMSEQPSSESFRRFIRWKWMASVRLALALGCVEEARETLRCTPRQWRDRQWCFYRILTLLPAAFIRAMLALRRRM